MHGLSDTSPDVERMLIEGYRRMPVERKLAVVANASAAARTLHAAGHGLRNPHATPETVNREWASMTLGVGPWLVQLRDVDERRRDARGSGTNSCVSRQYARL